MISMSACLQRRATDQLGPPMSARPMKSYTTSRDIIRALKGILLIQRLVVTEIRAPSALTGMKLKLVFGSGSSALIL